MFVDVLFNVSICEFMSVIGAFIEVFIAVVCVLCLLVWLLVPHQSRQKLWQSGTAWMYERRCG